MLIFETNRSLSIPQNETLDCLDCPLGYPLNDKVFFFFFFFELSIIFIDFEFFY